MYAGFANRLSKPGKIAGSLPENYLVPGSVAPGKYAPPR